MTFVVDANVDADQVVKQLDKLVDIVDVRDISSEDIVSREMAMIKVRVDKSNRGQIIEVAELFQAEVVDVAPDAIILEATGRDGKIDSLVRLLKDYEIIELCRTGKVAMLRGSAVSHPEPAEDERYDRYPGQHTW